jgi:hypothetical protein
VQVVKLLIDHGADVNAPRSVEVLSLLPLTNDTYQLSVSFPPLR